MVEFHFHDSEFVLYGRSETGGETDSGDTTVERTEEHDEGSAAESEGGGRPLAALAALAVLVAVAVAVRRKLSGDDAEEPPTLAEEPTAPDA
jgi:hypothetical protein